MALLAAGVIGVFPAWAAAEQFAFRGSEGAYGDAPVQMTLTGQRLGRPLHVASFKIGMGPVAEDCPGYSGPNPLTVPIRRGSGGRRGIRIRPRDNGQLSFEWHYTAPGGPYEAIQGLQMGRRRWIGKFWLNYLPGHPPGGDYHCWSNYEYRWEAKFVGRR